MDPHPHSYSGTLQYQESGRRGDGGSPRLMCRSPEEAQGNSWHRSPRRRPDVQATLSGPGERGLRGSEVRGPGEGAASRGRWAGPGLGTLSRSPGAAGAALAALLSASLPDNSWGGRAPPLGVCAAQGKLPSFGAQCPHLGGMGCGGSLDSSGLCLHAHTHTHSHTFVTSRHLLHFAEGLASPLLPTRKGAGRS